MKDKKKLDEWGMPMSKEQEMKDSQSNKKPNIDKTTKIVILVLGSLVGAFFIYVLLLMMGAGAVVSDIGNI